MLQFIATNILMIALGAILYLVIRALPRVEEESAESLKRSPLERWIASDIPTKLDNAMNGFMWKFFRKTKVFLLRIDNRLTERLKKIKPEGNGNGKPKISFKEIAGEKQRDETD